jgi:lysyl-tRNA synthetase class 1
MKKDNESELFWADQLANRIITREKYRYIDKRVPKFSEYVVKTSASISGVLHIGRLSDSVRGASVYRALKDAGVKAKFIWVAEDMDPLRRIPEGVPASYERYIGAPVSKIPDPEGCHNVYAEHHTDEYFKALHQFVFEDMKKFSMQKEYEKGSFNKLIQKILENIHAVQEIQNKYRTNPLRKWWSPWSPVCKGCGKIVTPKVKFTEDKKVSYTCKDYSFETTTATGCGYKGEADPLRDPGKLAWKSEWAAQWALWKVVSEGAGKEYQVPNSAFWINAEIVEKLLDFPSPEPIFYEHIMIDGVKMSASLGNVVYPRQWLEVATPQLLRFYYNKRLMVTRSFSWKELPQLYGEYDKAGEIYVGNVQPDNKKEEKHIKRLYGISNKIGEIEAPIKMAFDHAAMLAQIFDDEERIIDSLKKTGHYQTQLREKIFERIEKARKWLKLYAPDEIKFELQESVPSQLELSQKQRKALKLVAAKLREKEWNEKTLFQEFYKISKELQLEPKDFFKAGYLVLLNKERGPKLAPFVLALGERAIKLFESV